ncbi:CDP-alcohol phosphatidyltransferase family protein [Catenuloplanes niger JCM 9533]
MIMTWDEYATAWAGLHGGFDPRRASVLVRGWLRLAFVLGRPLGRLGVPPTAVTVVGLLICACVPLVVLADRTVGPLAGAALVLLAGVADSVDGAVAVTSGRASRLGHLYDSVADRLGEAAWLAAFWAAGAFGWLVVVAGALSWLHEYVRARASVAGMREIGVVTIGERPSRVSIALVGLLLTGAGALITTELAAGTATLATVVWVLFAGYGICQLLAAVRRALA